MHCHSLSLNGSINLAKNTYHSIRGHRLWSNQSKQLSCQLIVPSSTSSFCNMFPFSPKQIDGVAYIHHLVRKIRHVYFLLKEITILSYDPFTAAPGSLTALGCAASSFCLSKLCSSMFQKCNVWSRNQHHNVGNFLVGSLFVFIHSRVAFVDCSVQNVPNSSGALAR